MLGNIGDLFSEMYGTRHKRPFVPSVGLLDYYVMYRQWPSQFCETSAKVTNWVTDPLR